MVQFSGLRSHLCGVVDDVQNTEAPTIANRMGRRRPEAECQFSVSHAAATSFPASSAAPMVITGQNVPAKIAVRPSIEKAADTQASASATMNAASLTGDV